MTEFCDQAKVLDFLSDSGVWVMSFEFWVLSLSYENWVLSYENWDTSKPNGTLLSETWNYQQQHQEVSLYNITRKSNKKDPNQDGT